MALFGVSITKRCTFRDSIQEFSNIYHYTYTGLNPSVSLATDVVNRIVTLEKLIHSTEVTFVRAKVWSAGGTVAQNAMIHQMLLTGAGSGSLFAGLDRERAVLVQWPAGLDSRGHPVRLKKWFHTCGNVGSVGLSASITQQLTGFTDANRTAIAALVADLHPLVVNAQSMDLVGPTGRAITGPVVAHKYLEHHQLGDQWRG